MEGQGKVKERQWGQGEAEEKSALSLPTSSLPNTSSFIPTDRNYRRRREDSHFADAPSPSILKRPLNYRRRREDSPFADAPSPPVLKRLLKGGGSAAE